MNQIRILDDQTINQISAGEVVDRPVAVVRELVENAVDAGADKIIVTIQNAGKSLIKVTDNGRGMSHDDALLAIERHATSKITSADDLEQLGSLGFRGEALPSIAAVSKMQIKTRRAEDLAASLVVIEAGKLIDVRQINANQGTTIEVAKLFYNTPARKNFLKSNTTEENKIVLWLQSIALANPQISIQLYLDERLALNLPAQESFTDRVRKILPDSQIQINFQAFDYSLAGALSAPSLSLSDASGLFLIVNKRLVNDRLILRAVKDAFGIALKLKEFPKGFLHLQLPSNMVDVNVHPQKSEVRFKFPQEVFQVIQKGIHQALEGFARPNSWQSAPPERNWDSAEVIGGDVVQEVLLGNNIASPSLSTPNYQSPPSLFKTNVVNEVLPEAKLAERAQYPKYTDLKLIGQALGCYLVCEHQKDLYLVDLHAAHERYNYNKVRNNFQNRNKDSQLLLIPVSVNLNAEQQDKLCQRRELLQDFGLQFQPQGQQAILVSAVPSILKDGDVVQLIKDLASADDENALVALEKYQDYICARIACHASKRSGDQLSRAGAYALFDSLDSSQYSAACPHGRPTMIKLSLYEIEKSFGRT